MATVHMCDRTKRRKEDGQRYLGSRRTVPSLSSWLCVASFVGQKQPTVEAKLLFSKTAMMAILTSAHKSLF